MSASETADHPLSSGHWQQVSPETVYLNEFLYGSLEVFLSFRGRER